MGVSRHLVCGWGNMEGLVAATVLFDTSTEGQVRALQILKNNYNFAMFFCMALICSTDICLQFDLVLTLSNPFAPTRRRYIIFMVVSVLYAIVCGTAIVLDMNLASPVNMTLFFGQRLVFFVVAFLSLGLSFYNFSKGGLSRQYKNLLFKRHICYCILTIFCQGTSIIDYLQGSELVDFPAWLQKFCLYYFVVVALWIALLRLLEPIVWTTFKRDVTWCCRKNEARPSIDSVFDRTSEVSKDGRKGIEDNDELGDTLNAFLTSSLNVELVYTILKGIRRIVKTPDLETWKNGQVPTDASNDFTIRHVLENIKIRNFKFWENAH